jgi:hypothetical protein
LKKQQTKIFIKLLKICEIDMLDKQIVEFIKKHHVLTLATSVDNKPWCANCFYAFMPEENMLVFTSDYKTKHVCDALQNNLVAGSIVLETSIIGKIQGIQFCGTMNKAEKEILKKAKEKYLKRFPFAILMDTTLWVVEFSHIKMTDNRLGFGKKLIWNKEKE